MLVTFMHYKVIKEFSLITLVSKKQIGIPSYITPWTWESFSEESNVRDREENEGRVVNSQEQSQHVVHMVLWWEKNFVILHL